jgi:hypothetical protein
MSSIAAAYRWRLRRGRDMQSRCTYACYMLSFSLTAPFLCHSVSPALNSVTTPLSNPPSPSPNTRGFPVELCRSIRMVQRTTSLAHSFRRTCRPNQKHISIQLLHGAGFHLISSRFTSRPTASNAGI